MKVSKEAKIGNRYNQVSHQIQSTVWGSDRNTIKRNIKFMFENT